MNTEPNQSPSLMKRNWDVLLPSLSEVLQLGLSLIDASGRFIIQPQRVGGRWAFGTRFLWETFRLHEAPSSSQPRAGWVDCLEAVDFYYELKDPLDLRLCLLPLSSGSTQAASDVREASCYLVAGPIILPPPWSKADYQNMLNTLSLPLDLMDDLACVKVTAAWHLRSVMRLLDVIQRDFFIGTQVTMKESFDATHDNGASVDGLQEKTPDGESDALDRLASALRTQINLDDFLVHVMDLMIGISQAQRGSIMLYHAQKAQLELRAAKGFVLQKTKPLVRSLEEGLAGYALKRKKALLIDQVKHRSLIKRMRGHSPDLHQSLILPLLTEEGDPLGVINLATTNKDVSLIQQQKILEQLSRLTALLLTHLNRRSP